MDTRILFISFLVIVWWIAMWGLIELIIAGFVGNSPWKAGIVYSLMIAFVLSAIYAYPGVLERFL
jgi:hypothetical protein